MNCKYLSYPWRSDNFTSHLKKQHLKKWTEYNSSSLEDKQSFFLKNESAEVVNMRSFVQPEGSMKARIIAKQKCKFIIDAEIVESLIGGLLFDKPNDEEESFNMEEAKHRALRHFVHNQEDNSYVVEVKSVLKMNLLNDFVAVGVSFRQASRLYQSVKEEMGMGFMGSVSDVDVARHCRTICAINFEQCWAPLGNDYEDLQQFCGGIASVMPGTSSVESDFSLINWTKDPSSQSLTDFSLESILHCKQYRYLSKLFE